MIHRDKDDRWCLTLLVTIAMLCVAVPMILVSVAAIKRNFKTETISLYTCEGDKVRICSWTEKDR